ncbi:uncharacterized protein LOC133316158 [Gastrolobium bilobum]|uniref:uncharacterized protein LOC133316158 n=1 Tax=Gastrolobium bilobum TaxID=150636 RepID=UPI002AB0F713|nr:uncharacterized protein LOC133316158 [Gastrolobium bilobum]
MGRVYTLDQHVADQAAELVKGMIYICGEDLAVLFDSGATNSFIVDYVAKAFDLFTDRLQVPMRITTATGEVTKTDLICRDVEFIYKGKKYKQDFIVLPIVKINLILGMDWLAKQRVVIDCDNRSTSIDKEGVENSPPEEGECTLMLIGNLVGAGEIPLTNIPVVKEFEDVFPDDITTFPPEREVQFSIEPVPERDQFQLHPTACHP